MTKDWIKREVKWWKQATPFIVLGMIGGFIVVVVSVALFSFAIDNFIDRLSYGYFSKIGQTDDLVGIVSELCDTHNTNVRKVECVVDFYSDHYNFKNHNETIRSATKFIKEGGVCRDFAVNVCATIQKIGLKCGYGFGENHMFPIIQFKEGDQYNYCIYDGGFWCRESGDYVSCDDTLMSCTEEGENNEI